MSVNKQNNGKWLCHIDRQGAPRKRKQFDTQKEAEIFEREYLYGVKQKAVKIDDPRTTLELINIWYQYHGVNLSNAEKFKRELEYAAQAMGNPIGHMLTPEIFVKYRFRRTIESSSPVSGKTFNNLHGLMSAMYNKLIGLKVIDYENPLASIDKLHLQEKQMSYLSKTQIQRLLDVIKGTCVNESTWYVANLCLRTGSRWGEAEQMQVKQLHNCSVTYAKTKSKKLRTIPLAKGFYNELKVFTTNKEPEERVFDNCIKSFTGAMKRSEIKLPKGQLSHVLRHSFAAHFMMSDGNLLTLQNILGHSDIKMTMRYAHLSPSHLADAITRNPLAK